MKLSNKIILALLVVITVLGFVFRLKGISTSHSFWSDESYIASVSRDIYQGNVSVTELHTVPGAWYQTLHVMLTALMFSLFGATETTARIPSVILGTVAVIMAFFVTKKFSNSSGGLVSAFLMSFGHIMLVYSTQARPYAALSAFLLGIIYCLQLLEDKEYKNKKKVHTIIILLCIASSFLHLTGFLFTFIYILYLLLSQKKESMWILSAGFVFILVLIYVGELYKLPVSWLDNRVNNITYFRELFARQYLFITLPAIFGILLTYKKYSRIIVSLAAWMTGFLFAWNFIQYSHNVRYLVPFLAVLFVFFGVFWGTVSAQLFHKKELIACLGLIIFLYAGGYKIARKPTVYYNPNQDLLGDVQNANYKEAYRQLKEKYPNIREVAIFNDVIDTQRWYLPEKPDADAYFMRGITEPQKHVVNGVTIYGSLDEFKKVRQQYPQGIVIIEDWHSFFPDDIKQYAKENLKREIKVDGLPQANGDNWPIEIYSWGL